MRALPMLVLSLSCVLAQLRPSSVLHASHELNNISLSDYRDKRDLPLISTFDISKMFRKKSIKKVQHPSVASLLSAALQASDTPVDISHPLLYHYDNFTLQPVNTVANTESYSRLDSVTDMISMAPSGILKERLRVVERTPAGGSGIVAGAGGLQWPVKHAAVVDGDIVLGGLMMVHGRSEGATCGAVMAQGGVQALEAMLFALDVANRRVMPEGVTLGAHILDDCDNDTYGLEMAVDFIKGSIGNIEDAEYSCNATALRKVISGVVGAASSVTSVQVANLLRLFKIPQVSFFSTSPELSNKARFEYFTRTIPSDLHQVRAMVEIVKKFQWNYVSIIYEESNYGIKAFEELETLLARNNICIAVKERLVKDSGEADDAAYDALLQRLLARPRARGVIVFASDQEVAGVMAAARRAGEAAGDAGGGLCWVGSDGWAARALVAAGNEPAVEGTVAVQPRSMPVPGFAEYFLNLTVHNNNRNPWFVEYWEQQFSCRWQGAPRTPYNDYPRTCTGSEQLTKDNVEFEAQLQFVTDAVLAFAHAIRDMHADLCGGKPGLCDEMRPTSGATLLRYLRQVRFTGLSADEFQFDAAGDGPARYDILHYKQVARGLYRWLHVGQYNDGELLMDMDAIQFRWHEGSPPRSVCSLACARGQARQYVEGERCCWHCFNCTHYEIVSPITESCVECEAGWTPDAARQACRPLPTRRLRVTDPAARAAMALAAVGILATLVTACVWVWRRATPVVRASGLELSLLLLSGVLLSYALTFLLVLRPSDLVCALQRFGMGMCFTIMYSALLTKTNRIARIFAASKQSARRPQLISPRSQLAICAMLVGVQAVILGVWQAGWPARAVKRPAGGIGSAGGAGGAGRALEEACDAHVSAACGGALAYPALLVLVCTVHAVMTRNIPEAFNESKHIGFTMYTTCVIWLAFVPLYFGTASNIPVRVTSIAVTVALSASVTLVCLFFPKLYIIMVRPERNVRAPLRARWRAARAAVTCAGALLPPERTPSTDLATDATTATSATNALPPPVPDRQSATVERDVQTEASPLYPALPRDALLLDARRLPALAPHCL